jgi:hypothetical protein
MSCRRSSITFLAASARLFWALAVVLTPDTAPVAQEIRISEAGRRRLTMGLVMCTHCISGQEETCAHEDSEVG